MHSLRSSSPASSLTNKVKIPFLSSEKFIISLESCYYNRDMITQWELQCRILGYSRYLSSRGSINPFKPYSTVSLSGLFSYPVRPEVHASEQRMKLSNEHVPFVETSVKIAVLLGHLGCILTTWAQCRLKRQSSTLAKLVHCSQIH